MVFPDILFCPIRLSDFSIASTFYALLNFLSVYDKETISQNSKEKCVDCFEGEGRYKRKSECVTNSNSSSALSSDRSFEKSNKKNLFIVTLAEKNYFGNCNMKNSFPSFIRFKICVCLFFFLFFSVFDLFSFLSYAEASFASQQLEQMYCGSDNCYSLLELNRSATDLEIRKSYRRLSLRLHPDRNNSAEAVKLFQRVAKAYDVLTNKEMREAYDYYLDHPNDMIALLYGIRAVYPKRTNLFFVIFLVCAFITLAQYLQSYHQYHYLKNFIKKSPTFQRAVSTHLKEQYGTKLKKMTEEELRKTRESVEEMFISQRVEIDGKVAKLIKLEELYFVKILLLPFILFQNCKKNAIWIWKFNIMKQPYGQKEKEYLTYKRLNITEETWKLRRTEEERQALMKMQLWINEKYDSYKQQKLEEENEKRLNSTKYKQWKRWKKKNPDMPYNYND